MRARLTALGNEHEVGKPRILALAPPLTIQFQQESGRAQRPGLLFFLSWTDPKKAHNLMLESVRRGAFVSPFVFALVGWFELVWFGLACLVVWFVGGFSLLPPFCRCSFNFPFTAALTTAFVCQGYLLPRHTWANQSSFTLRRIRSSSIADWGL